MEEKMNKYEHGGDVYSREILYDFSANINPLGIPEQVKEAIRESVSGCDRYPDIHCTDAVREIAAYESSRRDTGITKDMIVCGNGAADIIYRTIGVLKPKRVLIPVPSFSEYEKAVKENNGEIVYYYRKRENDFRIQDDIIGMVKDVDMVMLCSPNNPSGDVVGESIIKGIIKQCEKYKVRLFIDECFMDFAGIECEYGGICDNACVIILRAFTKICAIPGIRMGYSICSDVEFNKKLSNAGQCWGVSVPAQAAGCESARILSDGKYLAQTVKTIEKERKYLTGELNKMGMDVYPSQANYILFHSDTHLYKALLERKIAIRNCENYEGLDSGDYRIAVRNHDENKELIENIKEVIQYG